MKPVLISVNGIDIRALPIFAVVAFVIFLFLVWRNLREDTGSYKAFDIVFLGGIISGFLGRIFYFFQYFEEFSQEGWSLLPLREGGEGIEFFNSLPWSFFRFWDGDFSYFIVPISVIISLMILFGSLKDSEKFREYCLLIWKALIPALFVLTIGFLLDGTYVGKVTSSFIAVRYEGMEDLRFGIQIVELVVLWLLLILHLGVLEEVLAPIKSYIYLIFPIVWGLTQILLRFQVSGYNSGYIKIDGMQVMWGVVLIVFGIFSLTRKDKRIEEIPAERPKYSSSFGRQSGGPLARARIITPGRLRSII